MAERLEMTIKMQVTPAQALALQAMFNHWNRLAGWGSSRMIGFFVDGDGNFKPKCDMTFSEPLPELTDELAKAAIASDDGNGTLNFDFDSVAWRLHDLPANGGVQAPCAASCARSRGRNVRGLVPQKGNDVTPQATIQGLTFFPVPDFDGPESAFGAPASAFFDRRNIPDVPKKFADMAQGLFLSGGKVPEFSARVDRNKAFAALSAWLGSFAPAHESKIATAAYALWLWTNDEALSENAVEAARECP